MRGFDRDRADVAAMVERSLIERTALLRHYDAIEGQLYRFPNLTPARCRAAVERVASGEAFGPPRR